MKICNNCGHSNADEAGFCVACGAGLPGGARSDAQDKRSDKQDKRDKHEKREKREKRGRSERNDGAFTQSVESDISDDTPRGGLLGVIDKGASFEGKHRLIANLALIILAVIVALVVYFASVPVVAYVGPTELFGGIGGYAEDTDDPTSVLNSFVPDGGIIGDYDIDESTGKGSMSVSFTTVNQSFRQLIEALFYIAPSGEKLDELTESVNKATENIMKRMGDEFTDSGSPDMTQEKYLEMQNKFVEVFAEEFSSVNFFGYLLARDGGLVSDGEISENALSTSTTSAILSLAFCLIIAIFAAIIMLVSVIYVIEALFCIITKSKRIKLFAYLGKVLSLAGWGMAFMFAAPMLSVGGGMFAAALVAVIAYFVCGTVYSLSVRSNSVGVTVKRAVSSVLTAVGFFVLCSAVLCNTIKFGDTMSVTVNGVTGYGLYNAFGVLDFLQSENAYASVVYVNAIVGALFYLLLILLVKSNAYKALRRSLKQLAYGKTDETSNTGALIGCVIFGLVAVVLSLASGSYMPTLYSVFDVPSGMDVTWAVNPRVWVTFVAALATLVFGIAYRPEPRRESD